jgi:hypothetical protein
MTARRPTRREMQCLRKAAWHEAGHVCVCVELRAPFRKVDIISNGDRFGRVYSRKSRAAFSDDHTDPRVIDWVERSIIVGFAGGLAQRRFAPRSNWARSMGENGTQELHYGDDNIVSHVKVAYGTDLHNINERLRMLGRYGDAAYRAELEARAAALVRELWPQIRTVAAALLKKKVLSQAEVRRLMNRPRKKD